MKYPVFMEKEADSDYGVTVPDLPGCFSAGSTIEEALENSQEAILTHIEGMLMDKEVIPMPTPIDALKETHSSTIYTWGLVPVNLGALSQDIKRINITIPENILSKIDSYAQQKGNTRSGFLASAALEYMSNHRNS